MVDFKVETELENDSLQSGGLAEDSPLAALRDRRAQIVNDLHTDIKVPRWDEPELYVRFKPVSAVKLNKAIERRRKVGGEDWSLLANADMLIEACIGVYAVVDGNTENKLSLRVNDSKGAWTKFDTELSDAIGLDAQRASDVVLGVYLTEGDLIDTANKLFKWSGIAGDEADESF
jgi:hypothetical protein